MMQGTVSQPVEYWKANDTFNITFLLVQVVFHHLTTLSLF